MNDPLLPPAERLDVAVATYLEAIESGQSPGRDDMLRRFGDVAGELSQFFADHDRMARLAAPIRCVIVETSRAAAADDLTLPPSAAAGAAAGFAPEAGRAGAGYRIGDYEIQSELGRGGMGVVYKARHVRLNRVVALKMVLAGQFAAPEDLQRFQAEAEAAAALEHPGIVPIFEAGHCQGQPYFSMAFVEGISLAQALDDGPLEPQVAVRLLRKVVAAVVHAHAHGVIHRDLKPGNILLADSQPGSDLDACQPKITDFGLAKREGTDSTLTASGQILGTPTYMSPEQAAGRVHETGPSADIYSLGAILYTMLTGQPPFAAESQLEVLLQVLEREPTRPRTLEPAVPRELEWICLKCLEKKPADRYATAAALAADLDRFLRREPPEARSPTPGQSLRRWIRRQPVLAWHTLSLLTLLVLTQVIFALHPERDLIYHLQVCGVLVTWLAACAGLQWLMDRETGGWSHYFWSAADTLFLTALLSLIAAPLGPLPGSYLVLVCAAGLFFQTRLVAFTTAMCMLAYAALLLLRPEEARPLHYALLFEATLWITGFVVGYQVWRMRVLRDYYEER